MTRNNNNLLHCFTWQINTSGATQPYGRMVMFHNFYIPLVYAARNKLKFMKPVKALVPSKLSHACI